MDKNSPENASNRKKSDMWNFFTKKPDGNNVVCKNCKREFKYSNNTSNMKDHIQRKHPQLLVIHIQSTSANLSAENLDPNQTCESQTVCKYAKNSTRKIMLDDKFAKMVAIDMQPLRLSEHEGLKEFVTALDAKYEMPGRTTLSTKILPKIYMQTKVRLLNLIEKVQQLAITTDTWTSTSNQGILAVTAHFISNKKLESALLAAVLVEGHHDADNLSSVIASVLEDFNCRNKVVAMVTDNASVMIKTAENLKIRHLPCFAHSLNLVIKHTVQDPECTALKEMLDKCRALVSFFKHSTLASDQLKAVQKDLKKSQLTLIQFVETRWNSSYQMLKRISEVRDELSVVLARHRKAPTNLTSEEYTFMDEVVKLFEPIDSCTEAVSGESYCTVSLIIPLMKGLQMTFAQLERETLTGSSRKVIESLKKHTLAKLKPYELRNPCIIATFLNPHFKKQGFKTDSEAERAINVVQKEYQSYLAIHNKQNIQSSEDADAEEAPLVETSDESASIPKKKQKLNLLAYLEAPKVNSNSTSDAIVDINHYISKPTIHRSEYPIEYWSYSQVNLKNVALKYLCIPATSTPAERVFSAAGQTIVERRNRLGSDHINELLFIKQNQKLVP